MSTMKITWSVSYLPEGREILMVPKNNPFMEKAESVRLEDSTEFNHPTGAVVVKDEQIIGFSGNKTGYSNKKLIEWHKDGGCIRKWFKIPSGQKYWLCPGCAKHKDHAESRAVKDAITKVGEEAVKGADIYLAGHYWCCKPCWDAMINAGIKDVYVSEDAYERFAKKK